MTFIAVSYVPYGRIAFGNYDVYCSENGFLGLRMWKKILPFRLKISQNGGEGFPGAYYTNGNGEIVICRLITGMPPLLAGVVLRWEGRAIVKRTA